MFQAGGGTADILEESNYQIFRVQPHVRLHTLLLGTSRLTLVQRKFVWTTSSVDFTIYRRSTGTALLTTEINGTLFRKGNLDLLRRDATKRTVLKTYGLDVLVFPTNGSNEEAQIGEELHKPIVQ